MTPQKLASAISKLPDTTPVTTRFSQELKERGTWGTNRLWYKTQKEHWVGWLKGYGGPGFYGRKNWNRDAEFVYNHIVCPPMVLWLTEASGISPALVRRARRAALHAKPNLSAQAAAIRMVIPWGIIEDHLKKQGEVLVLGSTVKSEKRRIGTGEAAKKPGMKRVRKGELARKRTARIKTLETILVEVFRAHWRAVDAAIVRGVDVAQKRAHMFFASNDKACLRIARRYYSPARAAKLAGAAAPEILRLSEPWLSAARESVFFPDEEEPLELRKELRKLVSAEYVALVWRPPTFELPQDGWGGCTVFCLPDESVGYGDVYEITGAGFSVGAGLRVCKSVAEPFLESERREAGVGIEQEFFENAKQDDYLDAEDQWQVAFLGVTDRRAIDVDITEVGEI